MSSRKQIQSELEQLNSSLPPNVQEPVFDVPQGYFENFAASVLAKIKEEPAASPSDELVSLSPLLASLSKEMPYTVPPHYFAETTTALPALVNQDPLPELLQQAGRNMPYEVPEGYFEGLPKDVLTRVYRKKGSVVPLFAHVWVKYAAAAAVVCFLVLGSIFYLQDRSAGPDSLIAKVLKGVTRQEVEEFLRTTPFGMETAKNEKRDNPEVRRLLQDVSAHELDAFLSQVPAYDDLTIIN